MKDFAQKAELELQSKDILTTSAEKFGVKGDFKSLEELLAHPDMKAHMQNFIRIGRGDQAALMREKNDKKIAPKDKLWLANMYAQDKNLKPNQQGLIEKGIEVMKGSFA